MNEFIGNIDEKINIDVAITKYGYGINCITNDGKMITFFDKNSFEIGKKIHIEGIVKEHNVFNNSKITLLKNVKYT